MKPVITPTKKQDQAWDSLRNDVTKYPVFGGGAGGGKSWLGCEWLLTNCYFYPGSKWFIGREELKRLMQSTFVTWSKVCAHHQIPKDDWSLNGQYNYIQFKNGSRIDLLDLKYLPTDELYERFGSLEYTGGWIEEAGEVEFKAFDVLKTRVGRHLNDQFGLIGKILITCNPKKNWLYQIVYKPWKNGTLPPEYAFIQSLYGDNPHTADSYGKDLEQISDLSTKQRLKFGNWEYDDDPATLINFDAITDLFTNSVDEGDKYISADLARYGSDKVVIYLWNGLKVKQKIIKQKQGTDVTESDIRKLALDEKVPFSHIIADDDGVGGGVIDNMRGIKGFVNNSSPLDNPITHQPENYQNLKTQCYYLLADYINNHKIGIETQDEQFKADLTEELEQVKAKDMDSDNKKRLIPKDEIKELLGRSPDYADALMMRMWFELKKTPLQAAQFVPGSIDRNPHYQVKTSAQLDLERTQRKVAHQFRPH